MLTPIVISFIFSFGTMLRSFLAVEKITAIIEKEPSIIADSGNRAKTANSIWQ